MLAGRKTYISAGILALATFARWVGWLDQNQLEIIMGLVGSLGLAALRAGIGKAEEGSKGESI
ncbi:MAG: hypothetical protein A2Y80_06955 [Deltaproteobacteria bacterium RBG_13_58_19]|nr:MAG: hypothetical protein A2Y80_06955 [Deltaproteobacteria bacterium RBG_13_58_19]